MVERKEKKKYAEPEMGYCPFEHWLGRTRRLGAHGARARGWALGSGLGVGRACARGLGARGVGARRAGRTGGTGVGRWAARNRRTGRAECEGQGRLGGTGARPGRAG